ncbi:T9SS type A sorting domain-containing protein [Lacinutrix chionoecetis]
MKTKLLLLLVLSSILSFSQAPVNNYFSTQNSMFAIVTGTVNQNPSGANAAWDFGTLTQTGTNTDTFTTPTASQLTSYPGTTQVLTITDNVMNTNELFYKVVGSTLSLTGASNAEFTIDYNSDNALIGTYPITFGTPATVDDIAGTLNAQGQTPSYTGTITTEVDGYGSLTFTVTGQGAYSGSVTRIKTEQMISFAIGGFFPGTATITNYNYYKDGDGALVFRTTDGVISVPGLGINETFSSIEALITNTLSVEGFYSAENLIKLYPNPVGEILNLQVKQGVAIITIKITDLNGRVVLSSKESSLLNVSQLQSGFYTIKLTTNQGVQTSKFIKK